VPPSTITDQNAAPVDQITAPVATGTRPTVVTPFENSAVAERSLNAERDSNAEEDALLLGTHSAPWVTSNDLDPLNLMKQLGCDDHSSIEMTKTEHALDKDDDETLLCDESRDNLSVLSDDED
jgi:hypothetical protein